MSERRAIPFCLLGLLSLLIVAAAVVGVRGPELSSNQLALQAAFQKTSQADSFRYVISGTAREAGGQQSLTLLAHGTWQSPDRLRLGSSPSPNKATVVIIRSTLYMDYGSNVARFRFAPALSDPFTTAGGNTFSLPPLQDVNQATDIVRDGNTFTFTVPLGRFPRFAFSTGSGSNDAHFRPAEAAINIPMKVTINDGFIVAVLYPHGLPNNAGYLLHHATWRLSDFGSAPPVVAPRVNQ
jgi:hypothetical protein